MFPHLVYWYPWPSDDECFLIVLRTVITIQYVLVGIPHGCTTHDDCSLPHDPRHTLASQAPQTKPHAVLVVSMEEP